jgi:molybdate transport system ATP-binding protein
MATRVPKPIVELIDATIRAGDRLVFRHTNWVFRQGENWALIGPNGSGKTLFASALTGAVPVIRGELLTPEESVVHVSFEEHKALAGDAPAAARWFSLEEEDALRVRELLSQNSVEERNPFEVVTRLPGAARAFARRRRQVVKLLGIEPLLSQRLPSLSNGEMRKVLLARALLRQPRLLILDDPFAGLDTAFRRQLKMILERLIRQHTGHLLLIATHSDELPRGITHLLRVNHCRVVSQGRLVRRQLPALFSATDHSPRRQLSARRVPGNATELVRLTDVSVRYGRPHCYSFIATITSAGLGGLQPTRRTAYE